MILRIKRHLQRRDKVTRLPSHLITKTTIDDPDIELILLTGRAKDAHECRALMQHYGVTNAVDLLDVLPPLPQPSFKRRLYLFLCRALGTYPYNPHAAQLRGQPDRAHYVRVNYRFRDSE